MPRTVPRGTLWTKPACGAYDARQWVIMEKEDLVQIKVRVFRKDLEEAKKIAEEEHRYYQAVIRDLIRWGLQKRARKAEIK